MGRSPFVAAVVFNLLVMERFVQHARGGPPAATEPTTAPGVHVTINPAPDAAVATIPLVRAGRFLLVPVSINGQDAGLFAVDFGASHTVVDEAFAHRLRLSDVARGEIAAVGGRAKFHLHPVESLSVGARGGPGLAFRDWFVASSDLSPVRRESGIELLQGCIGVDAFRQSPFVLDWRGGTLTIVPTDQFKPPDGAVEYRMRATPCPTIMLTLRDDLTGWFEVDTGQNAGIRFHAGFAKLARDYFEPMLRTPAFSVGAGGYHQAWAVNLPPVQLLGQRIEGVEGLYSFDGGLTTDDQTAGAVGLDVLTDFLLAMDLHAGRLWASYRPRSVPADWDRPGLDLKLVDAAGMTPLVAAADLKRGDYVRRFIAAGANPLAADSRGFTALHGMAGIGDADLVRSLLDAGASPNGSTADQSTPLQAAARAGSAETIELLIARGARPNDTDSRSRSALLFAAVHRHVNAVAALLKAGADPNVLSPGFGTALHAAAGAGDAEIVERLLQAGAKTDLRTAPSLGDATPLLVAANGRSTKVVKLLIDQGADINFSNSQRQTPLMVAAAQGRGEIVDVLLARGADAGIRDGDGDTALQYAAYNGHLDLVGRLYRLSTTRPTMP